MAVSSRISEASWIESRRRWQVNVQKDGLRKTFASSIEGIKGKLSAEKAADKWLTGGNLDEKIRMGKLWNMFLEEVKLTTSAGNYRQHEQTGRLYILPLLEHKRVSKITLQDWQNCVNGVYKKGLSKKTCKNTRGIITAFCNYARKNSIPVATPVKGDIIIARDAPVRQKNILQPDDIKKLFAIDYVTRYGKAEPCFFIYAWRFILLTGLRRSELCNLEKADINGSLINIRGTKTDAANRYFILNNLALSVLNEQNAMLVKHGITSNYIFPDEYGEKLDDNHLFKKWDFYRKEHELKSTLHELRHTLISVCKSDMPEELLKQIVGHTVNTDTFGIYGHRVDGEMERAANIAENIFKELLK